MSIRPPVLIAIAALSLSVSVAGEFRELDAPRLAFGDEYPQRACEAVQTVLEREDCTFLGGAQLNGMTSLRYGGSTTALNRFLDALARCPGVTMRISFSAELDRETNWRLFHEPHANSFRIEIAYLSGGIDLKALVLPEIGRAAVGIY